MRVVGQGIRALAGDWRGLAVELRRSAFMFQSKLFARGAVRSARRVIR